DLLRHAFHPGGGLPIDQDRGDVAAPRARQRRHRIHPAQGAAARHPRNARIPRHRRTRARGAAGRAFLRGLIGQEMAGLRDKLLPVLAILAGILLLWYIFTVVLNAPFQRELNQRAGETVTTMELIVQTMSQPKPTLPAPHQVAVNFYENTFLRK